MEQLSMSLALISEEEISVRQRSLTPPQIGTPILPTTRVNYARPETDRREGAVKKRLPSNNSVMEGGDTGLLKDILSIADAETDGGGGEVSLVEMYRDLMYIAEKLKSGIESALEREQAAKAKRAENGEEEDSEEEEEEEESEEEDEDEDEDEDDEDDDEVREKKAKKPKKPPKPLSDVEKLLDALSLHNQHKQHLLIKKAVLLKFEEVLFGNNNITMTIDLRQLGDEEKDGKLEEILKCKDLTKYMPRSLTENGNSLEFAEKAAFRELVSAAKCPNDILEPFRAKTPKKIAVNLIKQQYNIRWNTKSGESRPFDFYDLPKQFRKGVVRKAHIQTVLYEHKAEIGNIRSILNVTGPLTSEDVCPPFAYVKKDPYAAKNDDDDPLVRPRDQPKFAWQRWTLQANLAEDLGWDFPQELKWIDPRVKTLIKKLCQPVSDDFDPQATPFVMYLLVVNETTSSRLAERGNRSQIYIGAADDALKPRFLDGDACHCARVCALQRHFSDAETFAPVDGQLLVDFRLLLALARREERALFALKACDDARALGKELHDLIVQALYLPTDSEIWGPAVNMSFGLNLKEELKKRRKFLPDSFPGADRRRAGKKKK